MDWMRRWNRERLSVVLGMPRRTYDGMRLFHSVHKVEQGVSDVVWIGSGGYRS